MKYHRSFFSFLISTQLVLSIASADSFMGLDIPLQPEMADEQTLHNVNFNDIPIVEFIRFTSKVSGENFIFNKKELDFHVTFSSGKPISTESIVKSLVHLLRMHHFHVAKEENSYVIYKPRRKKMEGDQESLVDLSGNEDVSQQVIFPSIKVKKNFHVYKLQYHEGSEIVDSLKKMAVELSATSSTPDDFLQAIQGLQWVKGTNSLLFSGLPDTIQQMQHVISSLDVPLRQVFIEVLVVETDVKKSLDFGLQWAASGQINGKVGFGSSSIAPTSSNHFPSSLQAMSPLSGATPSLSQIPAVPGFDLGVIGDIILHKGRSFLTLGSLVSALQADGDSTIVLNQKIITQDNKHSKIFVGDNIPFTGSVVQTIGQGQQTTANIEYRDVGVSLSITPMLGEGDVITLDLDEEITEAVDDHGFSSMASSVGGIRTTKTNMLTHVHVPDKHFLVLSGMIRNAKSTYKAGVPCLGSLPYLGALFSKNKRMDEKRNIIIFVRPQIIHSFKDYEKITSFQEEVYERQGNSKDFKAGLDILPSMP